jgi:hypothetical protein
MQRGVLGFLIVPACIPAVAFTFLTWAKAKLIFHSLAIINFMVYIVSSNPHIGTVNGFIVLFEVSILFFILTPENTHVAPPSTTIFAPVT